MQFFIFFATIVAILFVILITRPVEIKTTKIDDTDTKIDFIFGTKKLSFLLVKEQALAGQVMNLYQLGSSFEKSNLIKTIGVIQSNGNTCFNCYLNHLATEEECLKASVKYINVLLGE